LFLIFKFLFWLFKLCVILRFHYFFSLFVFLYIFMLPFYARIHISYIIC